MMGEVGVMLWWRGVMEREGSDGMGREICRGEGVVQSDGGEERGGGWRVMEGRGRSGGE